LAVHAFGKDKIKAKCCSFLSNTIFQTKLFDNFLFYISRPNSILSGTSRNEMLEPEKQKNNIWFEKIEEKRANFLLRQQLNVEFAI
jgi:hypothetical protein